MRRARKVLFGALAVAVLGSGLALFRTATAQLSPAPAKNRAAPKLDRLPAMRACRLEYGHGEEPGFAAAAGFTGLSTWRVTYAGLLIRHPSGDVLVDSGYSSRAREEIADYPFPTKQMLEVTLGGAKIDAWAHEAVKRAGVEPSGLEWIVPSHCHLDHMGGVRDLPGVPVLLPRAELDFIAQHRKSRSFAVIAAHADAIEGRTSALEFDDGPYETFDESADLFGDGSVVFVRLPGHTPGHLGAFVNLRPDLRLFYVGDAVNHSEAIVRRVGKSFVMAASDHDRAEAGRTVARLSQLREMVPELSIVPGHDRDAWDRLFAGRDCLP